MEAAAAERQLCAVVGVGVAVEEGPRGVVVPVQAQLQRGPKGYSGTVVLSLGGLPS